MRALLLLAILPLGGCDITGGCENIVASRVRSPDGQHEAILFNRDCGATTGFSTQISVLPADAAPKGGGNVFIADGGSSASAWGGPWAAMRWTANDRLEISYDPDSRIFLREGSASGVKIDWRTAAPPAGAVTP